MPQRPLGPLQPCLEVVGGEAAADFQRSVTSEGQAACGEGQNFTLHWLDKGAVFSFGEGSESDF